MIKKNFCFPDESKRVLNTQILSDEFNLFLIVRNVFNLILSFNLEIFYCRETAFGKNFPFFSCEFIKRGREIFTYSCLLLILYFSFWLI